MMSPSVSPVARNVGVSPPPDGNSAVGPFEGSSVQQDPDSRGRRADQLPRYFLGDQHEGSPYQIWGTPDPRRAGCVNRRVRLDVQMSWLFGFLLTARQNRTSCKESGKQKK
uniref:Uncharacterized protein n=1 Tax=Zea mays TaxID=4577 RepID=A0A804PFX2_MAIZE